MITKSKSYFIVIAMMGMLLFGLCYLSLMIWDEIRLSQETKNAFDQAKQVSIEKVKKNQKKSTPTPNPSAIIAGGNNQETAPIKTETQSTQALTFIATPAPASTLAPTPTPRQESVPTSNEKNGKNENNDD